MSLTGRQAAAAEGEEGKEGGMKGWEGVNGLQGKGSKTKTLEHCRGRTDDIQRVRGSKTGVLPLN